jgi:hypothetical protein
MLEASSETSRLEDQITDEELERRESVAVKLLRCRKQMASNYSSIETISLQSPVIYTDDAYVQKQIEKATELEADLG